MAAPDPLRTTTVIVTYNSMPTLPDTLGAARRCRDAGLSECIVVDNTSQDGTPEYVAREHAWATLIRSGGNLGFGRGNNLGFEEVRTPFTFFLNPDAVCEPDALTTLLDFLDSHPNAGVVGPAARQSDGGFHLAGALPDPEQIVKDVWSPSAAAEQRPPVVPGSAPLKVDWMPGAALLYRSRVFRALGGFDPRFFLYFEETDLLLRTKEFGVELWAVGEAVIDHVGAATTSQTNSSMYQACIAEHYFQSRFYYHSKHFGRRRAYFAEVGELALMAARALPQLALRRPSVMLKDRLAGPICELPPER